MPIVKSEAFVLKSFRYGETSKIVILFTKNFGKINAIVKGARNFKSRFCGTLETMNYIETVIYFKENRDLQIISAAEYKKSFPVILGNIDKLELSFRIIEMINKSMIQHEKSIPVFELLKSTFEELEITEYNLLNNFLKFQINIIDLMGLSPEISLMKNKTNETFFDYNELNLNSEQIEIIDIFQKNNLTDIEKFNVDSDKIKLIVECYEKYLLNHTQGSSYYISKKIFREIN
ncbi:MAG: DNA repair protein RecO [Ignavibacteria bacterium]|nr:DNA repair protein RecO [Ignavibacteria bacterium]